MGIWVTIIQGTIFVACVLTFRRGIVGELRECWQRRDRQKPDAGVDPHSRIRSRSLYFSMAVKPERAVSIILSTPIACIKSSTYFEVPAT